MKRRDVVLTVVLLFVTCGLYWFYWSYQTTKELQASLGREDLNPGMELLLSIVTCGLFGFYTEYRNAQLITERMRQLKGPAYEDKALIILLLNCLSLFNGITWFVGSALLQDELNKLSDAQAQGRSSRHLRRWRRVHTLLLLNVLFASAPEVEARAFASTAFELAEVVVRARIDGRDAVVLETRRGFHVAKRAPLVEPLPTTDEVWLAGQQCHGASPDLCVIAWLPATEENQRLVRQWVPPSWQQSPLVAVVRIIQSPTEKNDHRVVFDVVRTLRGKVGSRLMSDAWRFEKFAPLKAGPQQYVMSAWHTSTNTNGWKHPFVLIRALTPVTAGEVKTLARQLAEPLEPHADKKAALEALTRAWLFHRAPLVAETVVGGVYGEPEPTGCGGDLFTLVPTRWLRGAPKALAADLGAWGRGWLERAFHSATNLPLTPVTPFAFAGGGHCYRSTEALGDAYLAAGTAIGGKPLVRVKSTPTARDDVARALDEREPRFFARPARTKTAPRPPRDGDFEPPLELRDLGQLNGLVVKRFEVLERGDDWVRCRGLDAEDGEWVFEGLQLPAWRVGDRLAGHSISTVAEGTVAERHALFLSNLFVPADANLDDLQRQADEQKRERTPR